MRKNGMKSQVVIVTIILILFSVIFFLTSVSGETIYVDDSGSGDYSSIQEAINNANESDIIHIYSGTYNENILINKTVEIQGDDRETTRIQGMQSASEHTIQVTADDVSIKDMYISNELRQTQDFPCIFVDEVSDFLLDTCTISNGERGIFLQYALQAEIKNCIINYNDQKGIKLYFADNCLIHDNQIQDNGDGMRLHGSDDNHIYNNFLSNNGYGILVSGSTGNYFYENEFSSNSADNAEDSTMEGSNSWYYNQKGNYWDDYQDYDSNGDGIGDNVYSISGGTHIDSYPLGIFLSTAEEPIAYIDSIQPSSAKEGDTITFQGHGSDEDGYIIDWQWVSTIDGIIHSSSADFSTSSLSLGTHTIRFRVKDNDDIWSTYDTASLTIESVSSENQVPSATIVTVYPTDVEPNEEIEFHGFGSDPDGMITAYQWSSNKDGVISSKSTFTYSSLSIGTHIISFRVKDDTGAWSPTETAHVKIIQPQIENIKPVAQSNGPYSGIVNKSLLFDGSDSYDSDDSIVSYEWDFGDGGSGSGERISHTYTSPGNYTILLTVTDSLGDSSTDTSFVNIDTQTAEDNSNDDSSYQENNSSDQDNEDNQNQTVPGYEFILLLVGLLIMLFVKKKN